ncbi:MAG: Spy/CpxP family protein refolding chaperone [Terriglobales bacterium]
MKKSRIRIFAASTALLVVLAVAAALAQGMHHHGGMMGAEFGFGDHMLGYFSDVLDLTQAQQDQAKAIMEKEKPTIHPLMQQLMQFHKDMSKLEDSGTFDEAKVRALAAQSSQTMTELIVQKARIQAELMQVLTADQKTKLQQLRAKHEAHMQEHMQKHAPDSTSN